MKITINNGDLENVHIDTYGMLTGESADEMQLENFREDGLSDDYDDYDWSYDHPAIVRDFAKASINYLLNELLTHGEDGIVKNITYIESGSPRYYNYSSDWYTADYEVDGEKLQAYITAHYDQVIEKVRGYDRVYSYTPIEDIEDTDINHAGLCHYINSVIDSEGYNYHMWESEHEVYYENTTVTAIAK